MGQVNEGWEMAASRHDDWRNIDEPAAISIEIADVAAEVEHNAVEMNRPKALTFFSICAVIDFVFGWNWGDDSGQGQSRGREFHSPRPNQFDADVRRRRCLSGGRAEPKKDGTFEMKSLPNGNYSLSVWGLEQDAYVRSIRFGSDDVLEKGVQVESGSLSGKLNVVISSEGAQLEGSVSDDDGLTIGARVRLAPDPLTLYNHLRIQRTTTDQLGHFSLTNIAPGKYTVTAKPRVSSEATLYKSEPQTLTLAENDHTTIEMKLEKQQK